MKHLNLSRIRSSFIQTNFPLVKHCTRGPVLNTIGMFAGMEQQGDAAAIKKRSYNKTILTLLDDLGCPLLLLPQLNNETILKIGLLADIRSTGTSTIAILTKLAKSFEAEIIIFNIPNKALPEMDPVYAQGYFLQHGMITREGVNFSLVNVSKDVSEDDLRLLLDKHKIDLTAAMREQKSLLYQLSNS